MEGVDHISEPQTGCGRDDFLAGEFPSVEGPAGVEKPTLRRRALTIGLLQVFAEVAGEGLGEFFQGDEVAALVAEIEEGFAQGELVAGDVAAEEDDGAPVVFQASCVLWKVSVTTAGAYQSAVPGNSPPLSITSARRRGLSSRTTLGNQRPICSNAVGGVCSPRGNYGRNLYRAWQSRSARLGRAWSAQLLRRRRPQFVN